MQNSNLIKIFRTFSELELKDFDKFVRSPFFNTSEATSELWNNIKVALESGNEKGLSKESLFKSVYPKKPYNDTLMRRLISNLNKLCEEYLVVIRTFGNKAEVKRKILFELRDRNTTENYEKHIKEADKWISEQKIFDEIYLEKFFIDTVHSLLKSYEKRYEILFHQPQIKSLQNFYASSYAKIIAVNLIRENAFQGKFEHPLWNELEHLRINGYFSKEKDIEIFIDTARLFTLPHKQSIELFNVLDSIELEKYLYKDDLSLAYYILTQYLVIKGKTENLKDYTAVKWKYYKKSIELIDRTNYTMGVDLFISIITNALAQNEMVWIKNFVKNFSKNLISEDKEAFLKCVEARIIRAEKNYVKSLELLSKIKPKSKLVKDDIKALTIMNLYELENFEEIINILGAYKKFLEIADSDYSMLDINLDRGFIKAIDLLLKYKFSSNKADKERYEFLLDKLFDKRFLHRLWVIDKFNLLKNF